MQDDNNTHPITSINNNHHRKHANVAKIRPILTIKIATAIDNLVLLPIAQIIEIKIKLMIVGKLTIYIPVVVIY